MKKSKGNKERQLQRRKEREKKHIKRLPDSYELIDGNFSHYPIAFCDHYKAWITLGLEQTHRCEKRHCKKYLVINDERKSDT